MNPLRRRAISAVLGRGRTAERSGEEEDESQQERPADISHITPKDRIPTGRRNAMTFFSSSFLRQRLSREE